MKSRTTNMRREYVRAVLGEATALDNPFDQFQRWFDEAVVSPALEPNAMVVATVGEGGVPSQRTVLLKSFDDRGFVFHTNYRSRKGRELEANPAVALLFFWPELERQVRIEGRAQRTSTEESDAYWRLRPRGSQLGALASPQSEEIESREWIAAHYARLEARHVGSEPIARPEHWGGIRVVPARFEFWQGRPNRLHDRLEYALSSGSWCLARLAP